MPRLLPALLLALLPACASDGPTVESAPAELAKARREIEEGRLEDALERLAELRQVGGLPPELRNEVERLTTGATETRIAELVGSPDAADELEDVFELELPRNVRAAAGVAAARARLAEGRRLKAYELIRDLDEEEPGHLERTAAAEVLAEAGLSLAADRGRYFLGLRKYANLAPRVLEYLVLHYPSYAGCDEAYRALAAQYRRQGEWSVAIARLEDLVLYHPQSPYAVASELEIPTLRLEQVRRVDTDRGAFVTARRETLGWLERHAGHPLEPQAEELLQVIHRRLARNDLVVARFYRRIDEPFGARQHAQRARLEAERADDRALLEESLELLRELPEEPGPALAEGP